MLQRAASLTRTKANGRCAKGEVDEKWRSAASDAAAGKSADVMLASLACLSARLQRSPPQPFGVTRSLSCTCRLLPRLCGAKIGKSDRDSVQGASFAAW